MRSRRARDRSSDLRWESGVEAAPTANLLNIANYK